MSRILSGDEFSAHAWHQPELLTEAEEEVVAVEQEEASAPPIEINEEEMARIKQQAYDEGLALGKQEGLAAAREVISQNITLLQKICAALDEPLAQLDETVEQAMLQLTVSIAKQIVRRELKSDPGQVVAVIREALAQLPSGALYTRILLHPDDASFVKSALSLEGNQSMEIKEDPTLARGGCKVETDTSQIDASMESRIAEIATEVLGGERRDDTIS